MEPLLLSFEDVFAKIGRSVEKEPGRIHSIAVVKANEDDTITHDYSVIYVPHGADLLAWLQSEGGR